MKMQYLLDTDTFIYIKNHRPVHVFEHFRQSKMNTIGISLITYGELFRGVKRSQHEALNLKKLNALIDIIPVQSMHKDTGIHYANIRYSLEKQGLIIGNNDLWIAAHAISLNLTLITNNTREFSRVEGLQIENWVR